MKAHQAQAEQQAQTLLADAQTKAKLLTREAEQFRADAARTFEEAKALEQGVAWVKGEDVRIKQAHVELAKQQKESAAALSDATAKAKFYTDKVEELKAYEEALVAREATLKEAEHAHTAPATATPTPHTKETPKPKGHR